MTDVSFWSKGKKRRGGGGGERRFLRLKDSMRRRRMEWRRRGERGVGLVGRKGVCNGSWKRKRKRTRARDSTTSSSDDTATAVFLSTAEILNVTEGSAEVEGMFQAL